MKKKDGFKMRKLGREYIVLAEGGRQVNFNKMISFNESAAYLWESLADKEFGVEDISALLLDKYEIDAQTASRDAAAIARSWIDAGLVIE